MGIEDVLPGLASAYASARRLGLLDGEAAEAFRLLGMLAAGLSALVPAVMLTWATIRAAWRLARLSAGAAGSAAKAGWRLLVPPPPPEPEPSAACRSVLDDLRDPDAAWDPAARLLRAGTLLVSVFEGQTFTSVLVRRERTGGEYDVLDDLPLGERETVRRAVGVAVARAHERARLARLEAFVRAGGPATVGGTLRRICERDRTA